VLYVVAAEAWAVLFEVKAAARKKRVRVVVEGVNLTVMRAFQYNGSPPWEASMIFDEILDLEEELSTFELWLGKEEL